MVKKTKITKNEAKLASKKLKLVTEAKLASKRLKAVVKIAEMARDNMKKKCMNLLNEHKTEVKRHMKECHKKNKNDYSDGFHDGSLATVDLLSSRLKKIK